MPHYTCSERKVEKNVRDIITLTPMPDEVTTCPHLEAAADHAPNSEGCEECLQLGDVWVHLRLCLTCGHVGCCDSSKNTHATKHFHATQHPVIRSFQPDETWRWCYVDEVMSPV